MTSTPCHLPAHDFRCPTKWDLWRQIMSLLPRGRAWQTDQVAVERAGSGASSSLGPFELGDTGLGTEPVVETLTVLEQYWAAFAEVMAFLHERACALIEEFFCATAIETRAEWGHDFGFPDACEPWESLCDKVRAVGGSTCAYLQSLAARLGYAITCRDAVAGGFEVGCGECGCSPLCAPSEVNVIYVSILLSESPAATAVVPFESGSLELGCTPPCPPPPDQVKCLIERFKPAHVKAIYEVIP